MEISMGKAVRDAFRAWNENGDFSGVFSATGPEGSIFREVCGFRNRAEKLPNRLDTAFAIASGTEVTTDLFERPSLRIFLRPTSSPSSQRSSRRAPRFMGGTRTPHEPPAEERRWDASAPRRTQKSLAKPTTLIKSVVTKLFTALAVCGLIDRGQLALEDRVWDRLPYDLGQIDRDVTVQHLLTHTSGIGDYIDEEASGDYRDILALYDHHPVHQWEALAYYLPMIVDVPPKFRPGERVGYSNAGFILLGLVVEAIAKMPYRRYVQENIIAPLGLAHTGFYRMNRLPGNVALGYVDAKTTNVLYMPIVGGSDGGLFTCAEDLDKLWRAVMADRLFSAAMRERFFRACSGSPCGRLPGQFSARPRHRTLADTSGMRRARFLVWRKIGSEIHPQRDPEQALTPHGKFGLGVYWQEGVYYTLGGDFGVDFFSAYFPRTGVVASALGNTEMNTYPLFERLRGILA